MPRRLLDIRLPSNPHTAVVFVAVALVAGAAATSAATAVGLTAGLRRTVGHCLVFYDTVVVAVIRSTTTTTAAVGWRLRRLLAAAAAHTRAHRAQVVVPRRDAKRRHRLWTVLVSRSGWRLCRRGRGSLSLVELLTYSFIVGTIYDSLFIRCST